VKHLFASIRLLTIVPLPGGGDCTAEDLARTTVWFPIVGAMVGGVVAAAAFGLWAVIPPGLAAVVVVVALMGASGGFHMDGLSDTADGFLSSRPRERILDIMKDSHIGAMGVMAIVSVILLKVAALGSLDRATVWPTVLLMALAGRCMMVLSMRILPPASPGAGLGSLFCEKCSSLSVLWALAALFAAAWYLLEWNGVIAAGVAVVVTLIFAAQCYRKIRGATGDTLGATCELAEAAVAVSMAAALFITQPTGA
jgi:adenosylcobinamide-GDP ribazoletransferase